MKNKKKRVVSWWAKVTNIVDLEYTTSIKVEDLVEIHYIKKIIALNLN